MKNSLKKNDTDMESMKMYILIIIACFYTIPAFILPFGGNTAENLIQMQLLALNPMIVFITTIMYTVKEGISWRFPVITGLLFVPTIIIFYKAQHIVFAITYAIIAYVALALGAFIRRLLDK